MDVDACVRVRFDICCRSASTRSRKGRIACMAFGRGGIRMSRGGLAAGIGKSGAERSSVSKSGAERSSVSKSGAEWSSVSKASRFLLRTSSLFVGRGLR